MTSKLVPTLLAAAALAAPALAYAEAPRSIACSVQVDYLFDNVLRSTYQRDFTVSPGATFSDDFSTATRFGFFDASTTLEADRSYVVRVAYFHDVGVFDWVDLRTDLTLRADRVAETNRASHSYFTSLGAAGERTTNWTLTCTRVKL